jgi:hypothetical protein
MTTILDIVTQAHRKLGVVAIDEPLTADQATLGLAAYNQMVAGWELEGIDAGAYEVALGDQFDLGAQFVRATVHLLAADLAPEYGVAVAFDVDPLKRQVQAAYRRPLLVDLPPSTLFTGRTTRGYRR